MAHSEAWERFKKSTNIGYDEWHDGVGYDLEAFAQMTPEEKENVVRDLHGRGNLDWRDMELLRLHGGRASFDKLRDILASGTIEERAHALRELLEMGKMHGSVPDFQLAHVLDDIDDIPGMTTALLLAPQHAGPMSNAALLRGTRDRPGVAVHYAGMVCFLAGATNEVFDWNLRSLFLSMGKGIPENKRMAAFSDLCKLTGIDPTEIPEKGRGIGMVFPESNRRRPT
jgi:hypothetical protein